MLPPLSKEGLSQERLEDGIIFDHRKVAGEGIRGTMSNRKALSQLINLASPRL